MNFWRTNIDRIIEFNEKKLLNHKGSVSNEQVEKTIESYMFSEREPLRDEVLDLIEGEKPTILERKKVGDRILSKIMRFVLRQVFNYSTKK